MAGHGGGAWKVAYADFVTAMMAFFLVMWIVAQNKPVREAVAGYFREPWGSGDKPSGMGILPGADTNVVVPAIEAPKPAAGHRRRPEKGPVRDKTAPKDQNGGKAGKDPRMVQRYDPTEGTIGATVQFPVDSAELDAVTAKQLTGLARRLAGKPNKIEIRGHAARSPRTSEISEDDAWRISYTRCRIVMSLLVAEGVEAERIRLSQAGPNEPIASAEKSNWRELNSRVDVYALDEFSDGVEEEAEDEKNPAAHAGTSEHATKSTTEAAVGHGKQSKNHTQQTAPPSEEHAGQAMAPASKSQADHAHEKDGAGGEPAAAPNDDAPPRADPASPAK